MKGLKKIKVEPIAYVIAGSILGELGMKYIPFGGKFSPLIVAGVGAIGMQMKGDMMNYLGAGMLANGSARFAGNMIPAIKAVSDDTLDAVYEDITNNRNMINGVPKEVVLLGTDQWGNEVYGDPNDGENYMGALPGGGGGTLMGGLETQQY